MANIKKEPDAELITAHPFGTTEEDQQLQDYSLIEAMESAAKAMADLAAVRRALKEAAETPEERLERYKKNSASRHVEELLQRVDEDGKQKLLTTGFPTLDDYLGGGFHPGLYALGAVPGLGKTSLALQITDHIAGSGGSVLFYAFEMSRDELIARSISRLLAEKKLLLSDGRIADKTTRQILDGWKWSGYTTEERELIVQTAWEYKALAEGHIYISESEDRIGLASIERDIETHIEMTAAVGMVDLPLVIVDYLQIIPPYIPPGTSAFLSERQAVDRNVTELKRLSRKYRVPILCISSFNRASYSKSVALDSFKESGGIEYTADVVMGLQRQGMGEEGVPTEAGRQEIVILKNRNGNSGGIIHFTFDGAKSRYQEDVDAAVFAATLGNAPKASNRRGK